MTGPTREEVNDWLRTAAGGDDQTWAEYLERFAALAFAAGSRSGEDARDAARYRWLRTQTATHDIYVKRILHDQYGEFAGTDVVFEAELDSAIDAAMGGNDA